MAPHPQIFPPIPKSTKLNFCSPFEIWKYQRNGNVSLVSCFAISILFFLPFCRVTWAPLLQSPISPISFSRTVTYFDIRIWSKSSALCRTLRELYDPAKGIATHPRTHWAAFIRVFLGSNNSVKNFHECANPFCLCPSTPVNQKFPFFLVELFWALFVHTGLSGGFSRGTDSRSYAVCTCSMLCIC